MLLTNSRLKRRTHPFSLCFTQNRCQAALILIISALLLLTVLSHSPLYFTIKLAVGRIGIKSLSNSIFQTVPEPAKLDPAIETHETTKATLTSFLDVVPSEDGTALFINAGGIGQVGGTVFANIGVGPGHKRGSYTMSYSDTVEALVTTATDFDPKTGASGPLSITTTLGLDTGTVDFNRAYIPEKTSQTINSLDGLLQLTVVNTDTFPSEAYVAIVPSFSPPGPLPAGHRLVGSAYSVRASGAVLVADRPMILRMSYSDTTLAGADPHTLAIFAWDAFNKKWINLEGILFSTQKFVSVATTRFTTYALMATPTWRDEFDEFSGLDFSQFNNVTFGGTPENRTLVLASTPGSGSAVSQPITPTIAFANWDKLIFSRTAPPPATTLTVDILSANGSPVLTNVASGTNLTSLINATLYPTLRLRVNMSSTSAGATPSLERWELSWQVKENKVYLPIVLK